MSSSIPPRPDAQGSSSVDEAYWEACRQKSLVVQHCQQCGSNQLYPGSVCRQCHGRDLAFVEAAGHGEIVSFSVVHRASSAYTGETPYVLAIIQLDEGPRLLSTVTAEKGTGNIAIGARVDVWFDDRHPDVTLPRFRLQ